MSEHIHVWNDDAEVRDGRIVLISRCRICGVERIHLMTYPRKTLKEAGQG